MWSLKNKKNLNFIIFINRKCLKAISSTKTKTTTKLFQRKNTTFLMLFLNIYILVLVISFVLHISSEFRKYGSTWWMKDSKRLRVCRVKKKKKFHGINLVEGNECIPKITITWIQLNDLTFVSLFFVLSLWILDLSW